MNISKKPRRLSGLAAIVAFAVATCIALPTGAALAGTPGAPDWSPLRAFYTQYGVASAVQEALIAKLQHGETLDSAHADEFAPVSTREIASASSVTTVATYGDGSILVSSVELAVPAPKRGVHPNSISGCTSTTGSGYHNSSNCSITQGDGTYSIGFKASYTQYSRGAQITAYNSAYATALYGSTTAPTLTLVRSAQVGTQPAQVTEHTHFTSNAGSSSEDFYLSLRVLSTSATTTPY